MMTMRLNSLYRIGVDKLKMLFSDKYLLYTNTGICVGMSCSADYLQQYLQIRRKELPQTNCRRSRDVAVTGLMIGPFCHYWYMFLDKWLPGKTVKVVAKKIVVDQLVCSPVVIGIFLGTTLYLEGKMGSTLKSEMYHKGKTLYLADWLIWPPAQAINFFFLPTKFRVLYDNCISFLYDSYFSHVKYGKAHNDGECDDNFKLSGNKSSDGHKGSYISEVGVVTGSHVPSIHINEMVRERTKRSRSKMRHIFLYTDSIATDLDVTVDHEDTSEDETTQTVQINETTCSTSIENKKKTNPSFLEEHFTYIDKNICSDH